jgi:hypothetical protein
MAWPRCPRCGERGLDVVNRANEVMPATSLVFRSYRCACGWSAWTAEAVFCEDPPTLWLVRKFAQDTKSASPVSHTPVTSDP